MLNASRIITAICILAEIVAIPFNFIRYANDSGSAWIVFGSVMAGVYGVCMIVQGILLYLMMKEKESVAIGVLLLIFGAIPAGIFYLVWNHQQKEIEESYIEASLYDNKPPVSWRCSKCGITVQGTYFCSCGHKYLKDIDEENFPFEAPPATAPHCQACGMEVAESDQVCPFCGNPLKK